MKSEIEKKIEKIFFELYESFEKGSNWDKAMKKTNDIIKKIQEDAARKLKSDRRVLISEVESTKRTVSKYEKELNIYKKVKVPNLQREILRLEQDKNKY